MIATRPYPNLNEILTPHLIKPHNYTPGRAGVRINMVVIHIMEGWLGGTEAQFNNPAANASAHYGVGLKGDIWQYVDEGDTAWHCGSTFRDNQRSIGIEHEGFTKGQHWAPEQLAVSANLTANILLRYGLNTDAIVRHVDLKPLSGHTCPGPDFPMSQYKEMVKRFMAPAPVEPVKPNKIVMPLYADSLRMGQISFERTTGKAFYVGQGEGGAVTPDQMKVILKQLGYASILKDD